MTKFSRSAYEHLIYTLPQQYPEGEPVRWYDPQPYPGNPDLASTFPHHLHTHPDIKHNRHPAPGIDFTAPNLPTLIEDCIGHWASKWRVGRGRTELRGHRVVETQSRNSLLTLSAV